MIGFLDSRLLCSDVVNPDGENATIFHGMRGVGTQINHNLIDLSRVGKNHLRLSRQISVYDNCCRYRRAEKSQ